mmetsp:Transcript_31569/g.102106  ORF Transcript_31569/g.102106 Transcript_31569/m.102106 type:complete len:276 (+) Transcript_31569:1376-2203(+)
MCQLPHPLPPHSTLRVHTDTQSTDFTDRHNSHKSVQDSYTRRSAVAGRCRLPASTRVRYPTSRFSSAGLWLKWYSSNASGYFHASYSGVLTHCLTRCHSRHASRYRPTSSSRVLVAVGSIVAARAVWRAASAAATASLLLGLGGGPAVSTPGHGTALWSGQRSERAMRASPGETVGSHNHERTVGVPWTEGWVHVEAAPTGSDTRACGRVHAPAAGRNAVASAPRESTLRQRGGRGAASQQADPARSHGQSAARPRARGAPPRQQAPPSPGRHTR